MKRKGGENMRRWKRRGEEGRKGKGMNKGEGRRGEKEWGSI